MKLWKFGVIVNGIVLSLLFGIFLFVNFNTDETVRLILDPIKLDLTLDSIFLVLACVILVYVVLLGLVVFFPLFDLLLWYRIRIPSPSPLWSDISSYKFIAILSLPLLGGIFMLFGLPTLEKDIWKGKRLRNNKKWKS